MVFIATFGAAVLAFNWLFVLAAIIASKREEREVSPVCVPFVGPVVLTTFILATGRPGALILLAWLCDAGTVMFAYALPALIRDWRATSPRTATHVLTSVSPDDDGETAKLSLHKTDTYLLKKSWDRPEDEEGITGLSETGTAKRDGNMWILISTHGIERRIDMGSDGAFRVNREILGEDANDDYSIADWRFELETPTRTELDEKGKKENGEE